MSCSAESISLPRRGQGAANHVDRPVEQVRRQLFVQLAGQHQGDRLGAEPDRHLGGRHLGQLDLRRLGLLQHQLLEPEIGQIRRVAARSLREFLRQPLRDAAVPVRTAELPVAVDDHGVDRLRPDPQHRGVERSAAQVEDQQRLDRTARRATVVQCGGDRLRNRGNHVQPGQRPGLNRGLRLAHPEIGGNGDHHAVVVTAQGLLASSNRCRRISAEMLSGVWSMS